MTAPKRDAVYDGLSAVVMFGWLVYVLLTFDQYMPNVDEPVHAIRGGMAWERIVSGFMFFDYKLGARYGCAHDIVGYLATLWLPFERYDTLHLVGGITGVVGFAGTWRLGRHMLGARGAFWAVALLSTQPVYHALMFGNPKDVPFAVAMVWGLYFLIRALHEYPAIRWRTWIWLGVACGYALGIRVGGLLLLCYMGLAILVYGGCFAFAARQLGRGATVVRRMLPGAALAGTIAWTLMVVTWPYAQAAPLQRPFLALAGMTHFRHRAATLFAGEFMRSNEKPWWYLPTYFNIQLTEWMTLSAVFGVGLAAVVLYRRRRVLECTARNVSLIILGFALLFPPLYAMARGSTLYSGIRHFTFVVPVAAIFGGAAMAWLDSAMGRALGRWGQRSVVFVGAAACVWGVVCLARLHPLPGAYVSQLAGGLEQVASRHSIVGYGAYREAFAGLRQWMEASYERDPEGYMEHHWTVSGCFGNPATKPWRLPGTEMNRKPRGVPVVWAGTLLRNCQDRRPDWPVVGTVKRSGVDIAKVRVDPRYSDGLRATSK